MKYLNLFLSIKRVTTVHISWHRHCNDIWGLVNEGVINNICSDQNSRGNRPGWGLGESRASLKPYNYLNGWTLSNRRKTKLHLRPNLWETGFPLSWHFGSIELFPETLNQARCVLKFTEFHVGQVNYSAWNNNRLLVRFSSWKDRVPVRTFSCAFPASALRLNFSCEGGGAHTYLLAHRARLFLEEKTDALVVRRLVLWPHPT